MRIRSAVLIQSVLLVGLIARAPAATAQTLVSVGAGGVYPHGTTFNGVPINGLQSGFGGQVWVSLSNPAVSA